MEPHDPLNANQKRHLLISAQYADSLLSDIESILASSLSKSPFPKYKLDITPAQAKLVQDYIARIRAQMVQVLKSQGINPPEPELPARRSIRVTLEFCDIAFDECRPKAMRGYGRVPPSVVPELNGLVDEMRSILRQLNNYLGQEAGGDLQRRLERLNGAAGGLELLEKIERIVRERGLVEFRPALSIIVDKLESPAFQIAVFGRVSSGKSSLLNHILGTDVLPVGVTPITAVPTRLIYGPEARLTVSSVGRKTEQTSIDRLPEFVSEEHNPANARHITRIVVEMPSARLQAGVVLVDTPGLGSLATAGAAETMAYLPNCDLGVVLIDAGSTLTEEDLATIRNLYEAAIPAFVLLSKADLLSPADCARLVGYVASHIRSQLGFDLRVWPVSAQREQARLLDEWFASEIQPLFRRHQELARQSVHRKIAALRDAVEATLTARLDASAKGPARDVKAVREAQTRLRQAGGEFDGILELCFKASYEVGELADVALGRAAAEIARSWCGDGKPKMEEKESLTRNLIVTASEGAKQIFDKLQELARNLAQGLDAAGQAIAAKAGNDPQAFVSLVKEMPLLDPGPLEMRLRRSFLSMLGERVTRWRIRRKLEEQVGPRAVEVFRSYGRLIEAWSKRTVSELHRNFDAQADALRAQLEQLAEGRKAGPEEAEALQHDLADLAGIQGQEQTPARSLTS
jgi:GTP-binding protein EngB required for normal cell division